MNIIHSWVGRKQVAYSATVKG